MPFHDITELPEEFCEPKTALEQELSVGDRIQITELLHRVYLCEDSSWYLQHRVYQQMSINGDFLPDKVMREKAAQTYYILKTEE